MTRFPAVGGGSGNEFMQEDAAETFGESDLSITQTDTQIKNNSVKIKNAGSLTGWGFAGSASRTTAGFEFTLTKSADQLTITPGEYTGDTSGTIYLDTEDGQVTKSKGIAEYDPITFDNITLNADTSYSIYIEANDSVDWQNDPSFPYTGSVIEVTDGYEDGSLVSTDLFAFEKIEVSGPDITNNSGNAMVEWPQPNDVYTWDAATFQASPDGETVEVYVEESSDGGSTWTTIAGPINRGQDITAAPDSQVRLRVELSRNDTANNPTLDAIYRRWVV